MHQVLHQHDVCCCLFACSVSVTAVPAQRVGIPAKSNGTVAPFQIYVEDDAAVASRYCWLTMIDSKAS